MLQQFDEKPLSICVYTDINIQYVTDLTWNQFVLLSLLLQVLEKLPALCLKGTGSTSVHSFTPALRLPQSDLLQAVYKREA